jgi:RHS repeat-associated protein
VPPGTAGLTPQLALVYSSHAGDGPYGVGWRLQLGEIRCTTAQRGVPDAGTCPRYELDGQLLTYDSTANRYHTFIESFRKVEFVSATEGWRVTSPNGTKLRYGSTVDSRIVSGGATVRWLLSAVEDAFGNAISVAYDDDPPTDPDLPADSGTAYPTLVTYAGGHREVHFVWDDRPDPLHDFAGGIERTVSRRLQEIRVESYGELVHRRTFAYELAGVSYTTGRSRLASTQLVGSDGTTLPREEFRYTDHTTTGSQWAADDPDWHLGTDGAQLADVNGDGRPDKVIAQLGSFTSNVDVALQVESGWTSDAHWSWSAHLAAVSIPWLQLRATLAWPDAAQQTEGQASLGVVAASVQENGAPVTENPAGWDANPRMLNVQASDGGWEILSASNPPATVDAEVKVTRRGFRAVDLDADGLADLVYSFSISGITRNVDASGAALAANAMQYVEGRKVSIAFRNTGTPCPDQSPQTASCGFVLDPALADGLPAFESVRVESVEEALRGEACLNYTCNDSSPEATQHLNYRRAFGSFECSKHHGLLGFGPSGPTNRNLDFCLNLLNYAPEFVDLNGDGYPDLIAIEEHEFSPESTIDPYGQDTHWKVTGSGLSPIDATYGSRSRAWIQRPGQSPRWVRAPEFDLPFFHRVMYQDEIFCEAHYGQDPCPGAFTLDAAVRFADLNRDGLTDVAWTHQSGTGEWGTAPSGTGVLLNRGRAEGSGAGSAWCSSLTSCTWAQVYAPPAPFKQIGTDLGHRTTGYLADLDGDGWIDFVKSDNGALSAWLHSRDGVDTPAGGPGPPLWQPAGSRFDPPDIELDDGVGFSDLNADGVADLLVAGVPEKAFVSSEVVIPDLLSGVSNGRGGTIALAYTPAALQRDADLEAAAKADAGMQGEPAPPSPGGLWHLPVVTSVTLDGPNQDAGTTSYAYAFPRFASSRRTSFGFRFVARTRPDGAEVEERYYQKDGRAGRLSMLSVRVDDVPIFRHWESWELPTATLPGSTAGVIVGRLRQTKTIRGFSASIGPPSDEIVGATELRTLSYDDGYGYNFVSEILDERPTGALRTVRVPYAANETAWTFGRLAEERSEDTAPSPEVLSRATFVWTPEGRLASQTDDIRLRHDASAATTTRTTSFAYDAYGNLRSRTDANGQTTWFCYDGDTGLSWCQGPPDQSTHGVLVAVKDPLGQRRTYWPDKKTGGVRTVTSQYTDEPGLRLERDGFGRVREVWAKPQGGPEFLREETKFEDSAATPHLVRTAYVDRSVPAGADEGTRAAAERLRTAVVDDGFGSAWKTVEQAPGGTSWVGTAVYRTPSASIVRETYPVPCADALCSDLTGQSEEPATTTTSDPLGRPLRVESPDGISLLRYEFEARTPLGGSENVLLERVLAKNAKGDLSQRLLDFGRVVWVDECASTVPPESTTLLNASCESPDQTYYAYEPTGELATIYDAVATSGAANDPNHRLVYHFDTLGRVRRIADPDGGTSSTEYDGVGNAVATTNARGQTTSFTFDAIGRPLAIDRPAGEEDVAFTYRLYERQLATETATTASGGQSYARVFSYEGMGRTSRESLQLGLTTPLLLDYRFDELGRPTAIAYPDNETVVHYAYQGAYLEKVCETTSLAADCGASGAVFYVGSATGPGASYDELGRRETVRMPAGTRRYTYLDATQRLETDQFQSGSDGSYNGLYTRTLDYGAAEASGKGWYDPVGNSTRITGVSSGTTTNGVDFGARYGFDERNRLRSWRPGSEAEPAAPATYFSFDRLGNLAGHDVGSTGPGDYNQVFAGPRPHAITAKTDAGLAFEYDLDGNLLSELGPGGARHFTFDSQSRLACVGTSAGACNTLEVDYDASGGRIRDFTHNAQGAVVERRYAGELFTLEGNRGDFRIYAFGEQIAYKRKTPVTLRTAGTWSVPWGELPVPLPWAVALLAAFGLAGFGVLAVRLEWVPGLREEPGLGSLALVLVVVLVLPPLPARAGGGGTTVIYRRWILSDPLGSATVVLEADGRAERETVYAPFGAIHHDVGAEGTDTETYAGHPREPATGLHYMNARWQSPTTGSFLSVDPLVGAVADLRAHNGYSYAAGNPATLTDPSGACLRMWCVDTVLVMGGAPTTTLNVPRVGVLSGFSIEVETGLQPFSTSSLSGLAFGSPRWGKRSVWGFDNGMEVLTTIAYRLDGASGMPSARALGGPIVIPPDFAEGSKIPSTVANMFQRADPTKFPKDTPGDIRTTIERASVHHGTDDDVAKVAEENGKNIQDIQAFSRGFKIFAIPGRGLTLGQLAHELFHAHERRFNPNYDAEYAAFRGLLFHPFETRADVFAHEVVSANGY